MREVSNPILETNIAGVGDSIKENITSAEPSVCEEFRIPESDQFSPTESLKNPFVVLEDDQSSEGKEKNEEEKVQNYEEIKYEQPSQGRVFRYSNLIT